MDKIINEIKLYSDVASVPVEWLWYPYIPYGKITLIQGDPGEGKSTMVMNIIAALSKGTETPDGKKLEKSQRIIYQCSEDGIADTIKPRLEQAGADCRKIAFIDEESGYLSLSDNTFRDAIIKFRANVLVIDPFQAYFGENSSIASVGKVRKLMHKLSLWASAYNCAVILVGHLNKREGTKELYRGLGSVDVVAAVRSVLQVGRISEDSTTRYVKQIKNSLAPIGAEAIFDLNPDEGFQWIQCDSTSNVYFKKQEKPKRKSKQDEILDELKELLAKGPIKTAEIEEHFIWKDVSMRTVYKVKNIVGIRSFRKNGVWYWELEKMDE